MKRLILITAVVTLALTTAHPQERVSAAKSFLDIKRQSGTEAALKWLADIQTDKDPQYVFDEREFLDIAKTMRSYGYVEEAIRFLTKATEFFPDSSPVWESLGYAQVRAGNEEEAVAGYERALSANPKNAGAQEQLKMIDVLLADARRETREKLEFDPGENTGLKGPYLGQKPPGLKPELFAPGIVSVFGSNENAHAARKVDQLAGRKVDHLRAVHSTLF